MAIKFLQNIDLGQNQLLNAKIHVGTSEPANSGKGSVWLDSNTGVNVLKFHNGSSYVSVLDDTNTNQLTTFTLTADSGTNQTVNHAETIDIAGGDSITTSVGNTNTVTIDVTNNTIGAAELNVSGNGSATQFLRSDADGSFSWAVPTDTNTDTNTQNVYATSFVDSTNDVLLRLTKSGAASGTQDLKFVAGSNITLTPDGVNMTIASANTQLSTETVQDIVGAMFSGGTETRVAATYNDSAGKINIVVDDMTANTQLSNAQVRAATAAANDSQVFTDADHTKLDGIDTSADVTTAATVKAALGNAMGSNTLTIGDGSTTTTFPGSLVVTGTTTTNNVETVSTSSGVVFEGTSADGHDATLKSIVAGADVTYTLPNKSGTVAMTSDLIANTNTQNTYAISAVNGALTSEEIIRLTQGGAAGAATDDVILKAGTGLSIARDGEKIQFTNTVTNTNTVTSLRRDNTGTYRTGNVNLVGGTNVTITETSSGVFNFASTDTNTNTVTTAGAGITLAGTAVSVTQFVGALAAATSNVSKSSNTYTITHGMGNVRVNVIITTVESPFEQVFPEIQYANAAGSGTVKVIFGQAVNDAHYNFTITR